jgi:hypothetical protein
VNFQSLTARKSTWVAASIVAALLFLARRDVDDEPIARINDRQVQVQSSVSLKTGATEIQQGTAGNWSATVNTALDRSATDPVTDESSIITNANEPRNKVFDYDWSVVGDRFPISSSALSRCGRSVDPCRDAKLSLAELIAELEGEPRDIARAQSLESDLLSKILSYKDGAYDIRALECRETLCAFEVASKARGFGMELPKAANPSEWQLLHGAEFDESNFQIQVTLVAYRVSR